MCCSLDLAELPFCFLVTHWHSLEQLSWILHQLNCRSPCLWVGIVVVQPLVMSSSLPPHCLHHARLPCPSLFSRVCSNSCPLNQWCHPTISSFVIPFSSCSQSSTASGSFPLKRFLHQLFVSGDQSIEASASASFLPTNIQSWIPLGLTGLIFLVSKGLSRDFCNTTVQKHQFFDTQLSLWSNSTSIHNYWKNRSFD